MSYWTDEKVEALKVLHGLGLSASQIARQLGGITRNACVGKVHRMGWGPVGGGKASAPAKAPALAKPPKPAPQPSAHPWQPKAKQPMPKGVMVLPQLVGGSCTEMAAASRQANAEAKANPAENVLQIARAFVPLPGRVGVPFGSRGCKWPAGGEGADMLQCGAPADESRGEHCPYCATHAAVAFQKPKAGQPRNGNELARALRRWAA